MRKRIVSIVLALCMVLALMPQMAFAETITGTNDADKFSWDNATVYYLVTDRFKNGNTTNDNAYGRKDLVTRKSITDDRGTFHGGDFAGVTQAIKDGYFENLGVNVLCISAAYEQIQGYDIGDDGNSSFMRFAYNGNYVLDYTNSDESFGSKEEFQTMVDTAHEHGLRVVMNVVMNHPGYITIGDMNEFGFGTLKSGWDNYYSGNSNNSNNFNKDEYDSYIDYTTNENDWNNWWQKEWVRASLPGYVEGGNDSYTQYYRGLADFRTERNYTVGIPELLKNKWIKEGEYGEKHAEFCENSYSDFVGGRISFWLSRWVREYGIDGFRCGTAEYVDLASWNILKKMCTDALREWKQKHPDKAIDDLDFWMTGECQDHGVNYDDYYTQGGFDSMINSDTAGGGVLSLDTVAGKFNDYAAAVNINEDFNVLSSISSDSTTLARGDQKYLGSALLLLPGGVQIFYGDETNRPLVSGANFDGNGGDGHSLRSDMNWDTVDEDILSHWQKVGTFRNNHIAVGAGSNTSVDANSGVSFVRTYSKGDVSDRVAACIGASAFTEVTMDVSSAWNAGDKVVNYYDGSSATVASNGTVTFSSGANGTILIGDPDGKPVVSVNGEAKFKGKQQVTISIEGADSASVSIDGGANFTAHDGDTFTIGETASEGATVTVSCEATNEKGKTSCKATFYKALESEDIEAPVISGVKDGKAYCSAQTVTVSDNDAIKKVTVNGTEVTLDEYNQFTLFPASGEQKIIATDKSDNTEEVTVTVNNGHRGGNATYTKKAICEVCGEEYGDLIYHYVPSKIDTVASDKDGNVSVTIEKSIVTVNGKTEVTVSDSIADTILSKPASSSSKKVIINATTGKNTSSKPVVTEHGTSMHVNLPGSAVKKLAEVENIEITLVTDHGKVVLDKDTIAAVASKAGNNGQVTLVIETVEQNNNLLKIELEIKTSNGDVTDFNKGNVKVTVAISEALKGKKPVCVYIDEDGRYHKIGGMLNADGTFTFVIGHFSTYAIMAEEEADTAIAAQKEEILAKLASYDLVARSVTCKAPSGKKAIRIRVYDKNGLSTDFFDGIEIYRSTKRYNGYGKKPVFVTKSGKSYYYNTAIKSGTKYYYRVRGFVIIDGEKHYTAYSLKAIRTAK